MLLRQRRLILRQINPRQRQMRFYVAGIKRKTPLKNFRGFGMLRVGIRFLALFQTSGQSFLRRRLCR